MTGIPKHPFWDFSLALYGRDGVARACLSLQDRRGLDVNILLFCCWAGGRGRRLDPADLKGLEEAVRPWQDAVVRPLRQIRRWLKTQAAAPTPTTPGALSGPALRLRKKVQANELLAEAVEQALLHRTLKILDGPIQDVPDSAAVIAHNILAYVTRHGPGIQEADRAELAVVLAACCPDLALGDAVLLLRHPANGVANRPDTM